MRPLPCLLAMPARVRSAAPLAGGAEMSPVNNARAKASGGIIVRVARGEAAARNPTAATANHGPELSPARVVAGVVTRSATAVSVAVTGR